ncbi:MAG: outer membrane protein assembly factor, partial [Flavobacteriaceae bacterium]
MLITIIHGCSTTKELSDEAPLLRKSDVFVNSEAAVDSVENIVQPTPNQRFLGIPFGLLLYQSAKDSVGADFDAWLAKKPKRKKRMQAIWSDKQIDRMRTYKTGFQAWKKRNGEAPVLTDSISRAINTQKLSAFFSNEGYFNARVKADVSVVAKKARVRYDVETKAPYF